MDGGVVKFVFVAHNMPKMHHTVFVGTLACGGLFFTTVEVGLRRLVKLDMLTVKPSTFAATHVSSGLSSGMFSMHLDDIDADKDDDFNLEAFDGLVLWCHVGAMVFVQRVWD